MEYPKDMLLPGRTYGKWCVIRYEGKSEKNEQLYLCCCECGFEKIQSRYTIVRSRSTRCEKCRKEEFNKESDFVGKKFGNCTILSRAGSIRNKATYLVRCDCGREKIGIGYRIKKGLDTKCPHCRVKIHGMHNNGSFLTWKEMLRRCNSIKSASYVNYGGRGITVCDRWSKFENFLADMGERPDNLSIDRINNDGNYEPSNCRWTTAKVQASNRRKPTKKII